MIGGLCGSGEQTEPVQIISAFDAPKLRYDPIRKVFYQVQGRPPLHGCAEVSMLQFRHAHNQSWAFIHQYKAALQAARAGKG